MRFLAIVPFCLICLFSTAQLNKPQLRMRIGYAKSIVTSGKSDDNTIYKMYNEHSYHTSGIGIEYAKPLKSNKNNSLLLGVFFDGQSFALGVNTEKFSQAPVSSILWSSKSPIRLYAGFEKRIGKKELEFHKNYFTFFGGLGISYNGEARPTVWEGKVIGDGVTTEGKYFQGEYIDGPLFSGYYMGVHARAAHVISPDVFAGLRWNIRNKKGNNAFGVELLMNYGLMTKLYLDMPYTLDGQPVSDRIKDKGVNVQLNMIIPLKNFGKRKKEK